MRFIPRTEEYLAQRAEKRRIARRKWVEKNPDAMRQSQDKWTANNRDKVVAAKRRRWERRTGKKVTPRELIVKMTPEEARESRRKNSSTWYHSHKHLIKDRLRAQSRRHREKYGVKKLSSAQHIRRMERQKEWRRENRDKMRVYARKARLKPQRIIRSRLCARVISALKRKGLKKRCRTVELIGCTWHFLRFHIESQFVDGMSWENRSEWHVDHIKPCAKFDLTDETQQRACFHFSNLRPLWALENLKKSSKWEEAA